MRKIRSLLTSLMFLIVGTLLVIVLLNVFFKQSEEQAVPEQTLKNISLVAIGDSLTEGVGDSLASGGYVPRVAELLEETDAVSEVVTENFGVSGDRSDQILSRMQTVPEIKTAVEAADIVVFTGGGNDIIRIFKDELLNVQLDSFKKALVGYQENLTTILQLVHEWNPETEIYVFGIYNPYEIYFSEIEEMQLIVDEWNLTTQEIVLTNQAHFIPLDTAFSFEATVPGSETVTQAQEKNDVIENPYLYEDDLFHPNDAGYSKMATLLFKEIEPAEPNLDK